MKTTFSELEQHAAELGLTAEADSPIKKFREPVAKSDKVLLGVACCVLATGTALFSVWLVVPTLLVSGLAAVALVQMIESARAVSLTPDPDEDESEQSARVIKKMQDESDAQLEEWNRDTVSNPVFRGLPSNIGYDDRRHGN